MTRSPPPSALEEMIRAIVREEIARGALPAPADRYLTPHAAAELASVSAETIRRWVRAGRLPRRGTGRMLRIPRAALEKLLERGPRRRATGAIASPEALADRDFR